MLKAIEENSFVMLICLCVLLTFIMINKEYFSNYL